MKNPTKFPWPGDAWSFPLRKGSAQGRYFSELLMSVNLVFRLVPRPLTTAMIASEMPAAISPYSMAVAPDSSAKNFLRMLLN
jgi:hypothetical protein